MIGGGSTDKDKGPGKEMARVYNGRRGIIGRANEREGGQTGKVKEERWREIGSSRVEL